MKTRLNLLTALIAFVFGLSVASALNEGYKSGVRAFEKGIEEKENPPKDHDLNNSDIYVKFEKPLVIDSVYYEATNTWASVKVEKGKIELKQEKSLIANICYIVFIISSLIVLPMIVIYFMKIMNSVKSAVFFDKKNIRRLRRMGILFILMPTLYCINSIATFSGHLSMLKDTNYYVGILDYIPKDWLIYGLLSFLAAEILAYGLRLKEEQDLTI